MISGPIVVQIIEAKDAVSFYREIMEALTQMKLKKELSESFMVLIFNVMQCMVQIVLKMRI